MTQMLKALWFLINKCLVLYKWSYIHYDIISAPTELTLTFRCACANGIIICILWQNFQHSMKAVWFEKDGKRKLLEPAVTQKRPSPSCMSGNLLITTENGRGMKTYGVAGLHTSNMKIVFLCIIAGVTCSARETEGTGAYPGECFLLCSLNVSKNFVNTGSKKNTAKTLNTCGILFLFFKCCCNFFGLGIASKNNYLSYV